MMIKGQLVDRRNIDRLIDELDSWLTNNAEHPSNDEGFEKLRALLKEKAKYYNEEMNAIVQAKLF